MLSDGSGSEVCEESTAVAQLQIVRSKIIVQFIPSSFLSELPILTRLKEAFIYAHEFTIDDSRCFRQMPWENSGVRKRQLELELNLDSKIMLLSIGSLNALYMRMIIMYPTLLSFVH